MNVVSPPEILLRQHDIYSVHNTPFDTSLLLLLLLLCTWNLLIILHSSNHSYSSIKVTCVSLTSSPEMAHPPLTERPLTQP